MTKIKVEINNLDNSEVEIKGTIPKDVFESYRKKAVKNLSSNIKIQGFRKGHVPEKVLSKKIGASAILDEMAELVLQAEYPNIIIENKINAIGKPIVSITKIAENNPLEFKIQTAIMPEVELPNYKDISKKVLSKKESVDVTEKEVEDTILEIRKIRAKTQAPQTNKDGDGGENNNTVDNKDLPEIDDEFVKTLGEFKDLKDFKEKLKKNLLTEKQKKVKDKKKAEIMEELIKSSKISLPNIMVDGELDKMIAQFKDDVMRAGGTFEEYLKHIKKTEEDVRNEWRTDAEKRAKSQLILNKIAAEEKIIAPKEEVDTQVKHLMEHYKDADLQRVKIYAETVLTNEKVFEFLEKQGKH